MIKIYGNTKNKAYSWFRIVTCMVKERKLLKDKEYHEQQYGTIETMVYIRKYEQGEYCGRRSR